MSSEQDWLAGLCSQAGVEAQLRAPITWFLPCVLFEVMKMKSLHLNRETEQKLYMPIKIWSAVGECSFPLRAQSLGCIQVCLQSSLSYQAAALEQRGLSHWPWHTATPITTGTDAEESTPTLWYQSLCTPGRRSQLKAEVNLGEEANAHHMSVFLFQQRIWKKKNLLAPLWVLYLIWNVHLRLM